MKHYAMATAESFLQASTEPSVVPGGSKSGSICGSIASGSDSLTSETETRKNPGFLAKTGVMMAAEGCGQMALVGDEGLEPPTFSV